MHPEPSWPPRQTRESDHAALAHEPHDSACCEETGPTKSTVGKETGDRAKQKLWPFIVSWEDTKTGKIPRVSSHLSRSEKFEHWQMRWGFGRQRYRIAPGLYAIGTPDSASPVLVTANYKMSFDVLRRELTRGNFWVLVLDTQGINVWCAAGKGTFGTEELVRRIQNTQLGKLVSHRTVIVPQLGAAGVAAHKVKQACGFQVVYGPVRASHILAFLDNGWQATELMRQVTFPLRERWVLIPVELVNARKQIFWGCLILLLLGGIGPEVFTMTNAIHRGGPAITIGLTGMAVGTLLVPVLLPWLPGPAFAMKGAVSGLVTAGLIAVLWHPSLGWLNTLAVLIGLPAVSSWFAMHFTGSTTFTSPSGVEREMRIAIPAQCTTVLVAVICWILSAF